ncbi:F1-ATP synthase delta subunit [Striga asiatica]|uniref:F1-ATP synthase delta subunit n=1 Tax=Striga asiatica TaxID=4170 RepID=A0A5A7QUA3_STRAF|nr:F1-ATP synthase delta subunit [Striga asiatica]
MAMAARFRSGLPLLRRALAAGNLSAAERSVAPIGGICPTISKPEFARSYASGPPEKQQNIKVPLKLFGVSGNYASALYIAAVKANVLDRVETELNTLIQASKNSPTFSQFMKDLSVTADTRVKAINDIGARARFSETMKNFLGVHGQLVLHLSAIVAESGRLGHLERIVHRFSELTMAHRGEVKATVTTVIRYGLHGFTDNKNEEQQTIKQPSFPIVLISLSRVVEYYMLNTLDGLIYVETNHASVATVFSEEHKNIYTPPLLLVPCSVTCNLVIPISASFSTYPELLFLQPLPPEEEKELKETLQDILGQGTKVKVEQKIDPSILGGIVVEFGQKVFDMSIKTRAAQMERFLRQPINLDGH